MFIDIRFKRPGPTARIIIVVVIILVTSRFAPDPGAVLGLGGLLGAWSCRPVHTTRLTGRRP